MRLFSCIFLFVSFSASSQNADFLLGARQQGLGGGSVTLADQWSLYNNIAGLAEINERIAFATYKNQFQLADLQTIGSGFVDRIGNVGVGAGFYRFGGEHYSEQKFSMGAAHRLDMVSLGVNVNYLQYNLATVGTRSAMVIELGGMVELTDKISLGAHIFNLNQARMFSETEERIPTIMRAGISARPTDDLTLFLETEKDLDFDEVIKVGAEYFIIERVAVRTGLSTEPFRGSFGVGFYPKNYQFDYAFSHQSELGGIHEISVSYSFSAR